MADEQDQNPVSPDEVFDNMDPPAEEAANPVAKPAFPEEAPAPKEEASDLTFAEELPPFQSTPGDMQAPTEPEESKFFGPQYQSEIAPENVAGPDFSKPLSIEELPADAQKTLQRLQQEAVASAPPRIRQRVAAQAKSAVRSAERRQRLGEQATPFQKQAAENIFASLQGQGPLDQEIEQGFDLGPSGEEAQPPAPSRRQSKPGSVAAEDSGGGQQPAGRAEGGELSQMVRLLEEINQKLDRLAEVPESGGDGGDVQELARMILDGLRELISERPAVLG